MQDNRAKDSLKIYNEEKDTMRGGELDQWRRKGHRREGALNKWWGRVDGTGNTRGGGGECTERCGRGESRRRVGGEEQ